MLHLPVSVSALQRLFISVDRQLSDVLLMSFHQLSLSVPKMEGSATQDVLVLLRTMPQNGTGV